MPGGGPDIITRGYASPKVITRGYGGWLPTWLVRRIINLVSKFSMTMELYSPWKRKTQL